MEPQQEASDQARLRLANEIFRESYGYERHLDEKIGRFLTAVAFLAAAAATIAGTTHMLNVRFLLPHSGKVALPAILFVAFFAVVGLVVGLLLVSLGPNATFAPDPNRPEATPGTMLFALEIAKYQAAEWHTHQMHLNDHQLAQNYYDETHNVALNAEFKYHRNNEALALFRFGLLVFVVAVTVGVYGLSDGSGNNPVHGWPITLRIPLAIELSLFVAFQVLELHWLRQSDVWAKREAPEGREYFPYLLLGVSSVVFSVACVLTGPGSARWICACLVAAFGGLAAISSFKVLDVTTWDVGAPYFAAVIVGGSIAAFFAIATQDLILAISLGFFPPFMLGLPRLLRSLFVWHDKWNKANKRMELAQRGGELPRPHGGEGNET